MDSDYEFNQSTVSTREIKSMGFPVILTTNQPQTVLETWAKSKSDTKTSKIDTSCVITVN